MTINITDKSPEIATLFLARVEDVYGHVLVVKGWL